MFLTVLKALTFAGLSGLNGRLGWLLRRQFYMRWFEYMGQKVTIKSGVEFINPGGIALAEAAVIERYVRLRCLGQNSQIRLGNQATLEQGVDIRTHWQGQILIGDRTYVGPYSCLSGDSITIGEDCLISSHVGIVNRDIVETVASTKTE